MSEDKPKRSVHIHFGGVIILIVIVFVLFKVDMNSYLNSPQFKSNISYIKEKSENIWNDYLSKPITSIWGNLFGAMVSKGVEEIKTGTFNFNVGDITDEITKSISNLNKEEPPVVKDTNSETNTD